MDTTEVRISVVVSPELHKQLKAAAKREHRSLRRQITKALEDMYGGDND
jgi:predicted HicB family RNase H-like nuclease